MINFGWIVLLFDSMSIKNDLVISNKLPFSFL